MTPEHLKGELLARRANLDSAAQKLTETILVTEENLRDLKAKFAGVVGASGEIGRILELLDQPAPAS